MREAVRSYGFACKRLGEANRTRTRALGTPSGEDCTALAASLACDVAERQV